MEAKLLPKYSAALNFAFKVLDEAFIKEVVSKEGDFFFFFFGIARILKIK